MLRVWHDPRVLSVVSIVSRVASDLIRWFGLLFQPRTSLEAEILFLRRQLSLYVERGVKPRRIDVATRASLVLLCNVTAHPSASWTRQQLREAVGYESRYEYLIHDRDSIFARPLRSEERRVGKECR